MTNASELWIPDKYRDKNLHRKAPPPNLGPSYSSWGGNSNELQYATLPGGAVLQFDLSRLTLGDYRQMRYHYQINASLSVLSFTMHQLDWWIECEDQRIADFVEDNLRQTWTRLIRAISQAYWAGFSPIVLEYENNLRTNRVEVNKFKDLLPESASVNWKTVKGARPAGVPNGVRPDLQVYDGIKQFGQPGYIPRDHTLWYPVLMENGDMRGRKLLAPAFPPYFFSQLIHLFANRYYERFGEPIIVARAPFDDDVTLEDGTVKSGREVAVQMAQDLRNRSVLALPNDRAGGSGDKNDFEYTIDFLESQLRGVDFDRYMNRLDEEMSLAMFVPILLFRTADVGSYNLGQAHEKTFMYQINGLAGDLAEYLDRFVLSRLVSYNFSHNSPPARFRFRRMGKDRDETIRAILQASIQQQQLRPDIAELGMALGMELHEVVQLTAEEPEPAVDPTVTPPAPEPTTSNNSLDVIIRDAASRLESQLNKSHRASEPLVAPSDGIGYKRRAWDALLLDGVNANTAEATVKLAWGKANHWIEEALEHGASSPEKIAETVRTILNDNMQL